MPRLTKARSEKWPESLCHGRQDEVVAGGVQDTKSSPSKEEETTKKWGLEAGLFKIFTSKVGLSSHFALGMSLRLCARARARRGGEGESGGALTAAEQQDGTHEMTSNHWQRKSNS